MKLRFNAKTLVHFSGEEPKTFNEIEFGQSGAPSNKKLLVTAELSFDLDICSFYRFALLDRCFFSAAPSLRLCMHTSAWMGPSTAALPHPCPPCPALLGFIQCTCSTGYAVPRSSGTSCPEITKRLLCFAFSSSSNNPPSPGLNESIVPLTARIHCCPETWRVSLPLFSPSKTELYLGTPYPCPSPPYLPALLGRQRR